MNILTEPVHHPLFIFFQIKWAHTAGILLYVFTAVILHTAAVFLRKCYLLLGFSWTQVRGFTKPFYKIRIYLLKFNHKQ